MKRLRSARSAVAAAVAFGAIVVSAAPAFADALTVRNIDTTAYPHVKLSVLVNGKTPSANDFAIRENGSLVKSLSVRPLSQTELPVGTVLAIDCSGSMRSRGAIDSAKAAARDFVTSKAANDSVAVVCFSNEPVVLTDFTSNTDTLLAAIDKVQATGETALWDAVVKATQLYAGHPELQPNIVLLSDGGDTVSQADEQRAVGAVTASHAAVFAIGLASNEFKPQLLQSLVSGTGGTLLSASDPHALAQQFASVRSAIANQYEIQYESPGTGGHLSLTVAAGALQAAAETVSGTRIAAAPQPHPVHFANPGIFGGHTGKLIVLALVTAAALLFAYAGLLLVVRDRGTNIARRLRTYTKPQEDQPGTVGSIVETGVISRAVDFTSRLAGESGILAKIEDLLEQANIALRPAEALFFYGAGAVILGLLAIVSAPSLMVGLMFAAMIVAAPPLALKQMRSRRVKKFESQLPDMLQLLGGSLRAGYSLLQGLEAVSQETPEPMGREMRRVLIEARLGRSLEEALGDTAGRMNSRDFEWAVMAIRIQREVGGNLAELLQTVAETMTSRERIRREIKSLTAEGRISALVMGILPVGLAGFLFAISPEYIGTLFKSGAGWAAVIGSALLAGAGIAWLQKIIKIEV